MDQPLDILGAGWLDILLNSSMLYFILVARSSSRLLLTENAPTENALLQKTQLHLLKMPSDSTASADFQLSGVLCRKPSAFLNA